MLTKVNHLLKHATENKYGVAAINVTNYETICYAIKAAERERMPIIIQFYPGFKEYIPLEHVAYIAKDLAEKATVPVGVHLDHSATFDIAVSGIKANFPSVMVDGSSFEYEKNVLLTKSVKRIANVYDIDIEAELGHVGDGSNEDDIVNAEKYTSVAQAVDFVRETGCDSLAVAVGNAHGAYVTVPNLDFNRIAQLRKALDIPLVLHGCSDIPDEQMQEAVNLGMSKFNIATEYFRAMYVAAEKTINSDKVKGDGIAFLKELEEPMIEFVVKKIQLLNPNKIRL